MNWIKRQWIKFRKWITVLILGTTAIAITQFSTPVGTIPPCDVNSAKVTNVANSLANKTRSERVNIKSCEFAKLKNIAKEKRIDYFGGYIEIKEINFIDGRIEVLARAWDKNDQQIGFGKDGTVDIERFLIINPPIFVPDPNGNYQTKNSDGSITGTFREDLKEALLQSLSHTISVKKEKFSEEKIIKGKIGRTTTTVYPDVGDPGADTNDGYVNHENTGSTWTNIHDAVTGTVAESSDSSAAARSAEVVSGTGNYRMSRLFFLFLTSSVPATDTISSATLSLAGQGLSSNTDNDGQDYLVVVKTTPAAANDLVTADFDQIGTTALSNTLIDYGSFAIGSYNDFLLNATGLANIARSGETTCNPPNVSGVSCFGTREGHDYENVSIADDTDNNLAVRMVDLAGTTTDPKLVIEHAGAAGKPRRGII